MLRKAASIELSVIERWKEKGGQHSYNSQQREAEEL